MRTLLSVLTSLMLLMGALLSTSGCCLKWNYYGVGDWVQKIDGPEVTHAIQHYITYLKHVHRLRLEDSGVYYRDYIHTLRLEFVSMDVWEICDARELLVDVVEGLLLELNTNPILAPQFLEYPLSADALEVYISFESFEKMVDPYYVGYVSLEGGTVTFYANTLEDEVNDIWDGNNIWDYRIEPYFKSREIVLYGREAEALFKTAFEMDYPSCLKKEQYCPREKPKPRYYTDYTNQYSYDHP